MCDDSTGFWNAFQFRCVLLFLFSLYPAWNMHFCCLSMQSVETVEFIYIAKNGNWRLGKMPLFVSSLVLFSSFLFFCLLRFFILFVSLFEKGTYSEYIVVIVTGFVFKQECVHFCYIIYCKNVLFSIFALSFGIKWGCIGVYNTYTLTLN